MTKHLFHLIGFASGEAGVEKSCATGPIALRASSFLRELIESGLAIKWDAMLQPIQEEKSPDQIVQEISIRLAKIISLLVQEKAKFSVIGGDHTSAIGTWSGAYDALHQEGEIGLIWVDAHMDSHTPETTESGRLHGMPLANLLGYGYKTLCEVLHAAPKIKPENLCLIGVRSFENGEAELLRRLNVRVYLIEEIKARGFKAVWEEAIKLVRQNTVGYGVSLDLDSIDPLDAPAVDVPEPDGIKAAEIAAGLMQIANDPKLIGTEIVEFNPTKDKNYLTEKLIIRLLNHLAT